MSNLNLWIEITISGFFYFLATFFLFLSLTGIFDLTFINALKDYVTALSVAIVIISYIFGSLAQKIIPLVFRLPLRMVRRLFRITSTIPYNESESMYSASIAFVRQYGTERLNREIDIQFSALMMFSLLSVGFPLLGLSAFVWLNNTSQKHLSVPILITCIIVGAFCFFTYIRHRREYGNFVRAAFGEINTIRNRISSTSTATEQSEYETKISIQPKEKRMRKNKNAT